MPTYDYQCSGCKKHTTLMTSIARRKEKCEEPCEECGEAVTMIIGAPQIVSGVRVTDKRPDGWRDVLGNIKKSSGKTSTIDN